MEKGSLGIVLQDQFHRDMVGVGGREVVGDIPAAHDPVPEVGGDVDKVDAACEAVFPVVLPVRPPGVHEPEVEDRLADSEVELSVREVVVAGVHFLLLLFPLQVFAVGIDRAVEGRNRVEVAHDDPFLERTALFYRFENGSDLPAAGFVQVRVQVQDDDVVSFDLAFDEAMPHVVEDLVHVDDGRFGGDRHREFSPRSDRTRNEFRVLADDGVVVAVFGGERFERELREIVDLLQGQNVRILLPDPFREQTFSLGRIPPHPVKDVVTDYFQVFRFAPRDAGDGQACARCRKEDRCSEFLDGFHWVGSLGYL